MRIVSTSDYFAQKETILVSRMQANPPAKGGKAKKALTTSALAQHNAKAMAASMQKASVCSNSVSGSAEAEKKEKAEKRGNNLLRRPPQLARQRKRTRRHPPRNPVSQSARKAHPPPGRNRLCHTLSGAVFCPYP